MLDVFLNITKPVSQIREHILPTGILVNDQARMDQGQLLCFPEDSLQGKAALSNGCEAVMNVVH